jgi:cytochrome c553
MMSDHESPYAWSNPGFRWSVIWLAVLFVVTALVGFVVLPMAQEDYSVRGLWASICKAAGVPGEWGDPKEAAHPGGQSTMVVLDRPMARAGAADAIGRGATLALNCTMCHGAQGMSLADAPNLSGQYPEVVVKQLRDYRDARRTSSIMQAIARGLSDANIDDLAAYYASLPKARIAATTYEDALPRLVRTGDPLRNIAPCISCHGSVDQKLGAPWLEGMPRRYLIAQLNDFASGARRNDSLAQMRNMVRLMKPEEIAEVAGFYARRGGPGEAH